MARLKGFLIRPELAGQRSPYCASSGSSHRSSPGCGRSGEAVQQRSGQPLRTEDLGTLVERQIGGHQDGAPLVALTEDLENLVSVGQHQALVPQILSVGVSAHRHPGVAVESSAHLSLAPHYGMAARCYGRRGSGYAHIRPFMTELPGRKARI